MQLPIFNHPPTPQESHFDTGPRSIGAVKVLRISVTDRCNFRCVYCMPEDGVVWLPKDDILSFEEICDIVKAAIEVHGIRRFKLTGGEPTVRRGIVELVRLIGTINGVEDLSLTTNGLLLEELSRPLKQAGLNRVTVSIDSLNPERFQKITRTGDLKTVLRGLDRAEEEGLLPLKINCVTMRGTNDDELVDFARLSLDRAVTVRFIEYMPLGDAALLSPRKDVEPPRRQDAKEENTKIGTEFDSVTPSSLASWRLGGSISPSEIGPAGGCGAQDRGADSLVPEAEARERIERELGPLVPVDRDSEAGVGPANVFRLAVGNPRGRIGFISAMSQPFCATCNRLRLTANGILRSCLFEGGEVDLKPIIRTEPRTAMSNKIAHAMTECVRLKPEVHSKHGNQQMSRIGG